MIELWDTFNNTLINRSRKIQTAVIKQMKHINKVKKANGQNSYVTYSFKYANGISVCPDLVIETKMNIFNEN